MRSTSNRSQRLYTKFNEKQQEKLINFKNKLRNKELTFLKFGFKSEEKIDNLPIRDLSRCRESRGIMQINDLWSTRQINKFIEIQKFTKDKFILQSLNRSRVINKIPHLQLGQINIEIKPFYSPQSKKTLPEIISEINKITEDNKLLKKILSKR
ncbi:hypothetical protein pb186bvf_004636 [Paramecium bursaria]